MTFDISNYTKWKEDLNHNIKFNDYRDDLDLGWGDFPQLPPRIISITHPEHGYGITQSECDLKNIRHHFLKIKDKCKCILEIGVDCNATPTDKSSTRIFLDNKRDDTIYVGVDIEDKSSLNDESKNIFTLKHDSSDVDTIIKFIKSKGVNQIDFLFIDGWHSINQVMREWEYTRWLSDFGIVGFHDTSIHPGPHFFINAINKDKWNVIENACSSDLNDYGVGFAWKKKDPKKYNDFTLVIQGPIDNPNRLDALSSIEYYRSTFSEIILSTYTEHLAENWNVQKFCEDNGIKIVHQSINEGITDLSFSDFSENHHFDNDCGLKFQTITSLHGFRHVKTKYLVKHRIDEKYSNIDLLLDKFLNDTNKLVTGGTFFGQKIYFEYCAADHLMVGKTEKMIETFQRTLDMINENVLDSGPEIMYTKNFIRSHGELPTTENHDNLMRKYIDFLPDKYMEPFVIRANHWNQVWYNAESLGEERNVFETVNDMIKSDHVVLNRFYTQQ